MLFPFKGEPGSMNYVAKAKREDILLLMLEFVYRNLGGPPGVLTNEPEKQPEPAMEPNTGLCKVKNPFRKETWNLTEQMRILRTDPQLAARLKAAAEERK